MTCKTGTKILAALGVVLLASPLLWASPAKESGMAADGQLTLWFMKTDNGRPLPAEVDMNDNPWTRVIAEGLPDIDVTWLLIPEETFAEQKNIMIAAGDIPDMFPVSHKEMPKWADNGLLRPLDDLVAEHYPNQGEFFDQDTWERAFDSFASYQGQQYRLLVPQNSHRTHQVLLLRKDWLDKLGLEVPDTLDELMTVMKAFTFDDPDGNGENDTFGFTGYRELGRMNPFLNPFGVEDDRGNLHWSTADGQLVPDFIRPEMKQALAYVREMFESGVYDKESLVTNSRPAVEEKFLSGKVGISTTDDRGYYIRVDGTARENGFDVVLLPPLAGPTGERMTHLNPGIRQGPNQYGMSTVAPHPEAGVMLWHWLFSFDTTVEYKALHADRVENGTPGLHSELNALGTFLLSRSKNYNDQVFYDEYRRGYSIQCCYGAVAPTEELAAVAPHGASMLAFVPHAHLTEKFVAGPREIELLPPLRTYFDELKMNIITGNAPLDAFDEWVEFFWANGGQEIVDEANGRS